MLPHLGAGAGQGIEDVYVLWRLLSLPQTKLSNLAVSSLCYFESEWILAHIIIGCSTSV